MVESPHLSLIALQCTMSLQRKLERLNSSVATRGVHVGVPPEVIVVSKPNHLSIESVLARPSSSANIASRKARPIAATCRAQQDGRIQIEIYTLVLLAGSMKLSTIYYENGVIREVHWLRDVATPAERLKRSTG